MSIRVTCPNCQRLLQVPSGTAGSEAMCPQCETVFTITEQTQTESLMAGSEGPFTEAASVAANPFAAPQTAGPTGQDPAEGTLSAVAIPVDVEAICSCAFEAWKQHWGILVGMTVIVSMVSGVVQLLGRTLSTALDMVDVPEAWSLAIVMLVSSLAALPQWYVQAGMTGVILKLLRGQPTEFSEVLSGGGRFGAVAGVMIPFTLLTILGSLFCVVPGVFVWLAYWPCFYLAVDGQDDVMARSRQLTKGHLLTGLLLSLVATLLYFVGVLACCVGVVFSGSLVSVMWATAYLAMLSQLSESPEEPVV